MTEWDNNGNWSERPNADETQPMSGTPAGEGAPRGAAQDPHAAEAEYRAGRETAEQRATGATSAAYGADHASAAHSAGAATAAPDDAHVRKLVRDEIQRNYRPKSHWGRALALVLLGGLLGTAGGAALVSSGVVTLPTSAVQQALAGNGAGENVTGKGNGANGAGTQSVTVSLENGKSTVENAVAAKAIPSIVGITTVTQNIVRSPFFYSMPGFTQEQQATGSGVILSEDGYILTNAHVVGSENPESLRVLLDTDEEIDAKIVWQDTSLDLAVIKIDKTGLTPIEFASEAAEVGDKAVAIGNPLGLDLQSTLTSGYISGLNRTIQLEDGSIMEGLIQTDAAINSGNSGGALLNAEGKLVGVNTARPATADGIGFAIPISTIQPIVEKILQDGAYTPLYLGISGGNVAQAARAMQTDFPTDSGIWVNQVLDGMAADKAGIQPGDIITHIDGQPVDSMNRLKTLLLQFKPGDSTQITYYRGEDSHTTELVFTDDVPPATDTPASPNTPPASEVAPDDPQRTRP